MMSLAKQKPLLAIAGALTLVTAGVAVQGRQEPVPEGAQEQAKAAPPPAAGAEGAAVPDLPANRALARKQLVLIDEAWDLMLTLAPNARIEISTGTYGQWGRRRLEALRKSGAGKAETVAALEKYVKDLKELEAIAKAQKEVARATQLGVHEMQFLRMEAEIWLNEEKAR